MGHLMYISMVKLQNSQNKHRGHDLSFLYFSEGIFVLKGHNLKRLGNTVKGDYGILAELGNETYFVK